MSLLRSHKTDVFKGQRLIEHLWIEFKIDLSK